MAKSKKLSTADIILIVVAVVGLLLTIFGLLLDYIKATDSYGNSGTDTISGLYQAESLYTGLGAMSAFAYITLALTIISAVALIVLKLINVKYSNIILIVLGALTAVSAIVAIITASTLKTIFPYDLSPAVGAWLLLIGGIACGAASVLGGLNVLNKKNA